MSQTASIPRPNRVTSRNGGQRGGVTSIPLLDLRAQYESIKGEINNAVRRVMSDADFFRGEVVDLFEKDFAAYYGVAQAIGVSSGTEALQLALLACGVERNDEVITTPFSYPMTTDAISCLRAIPVFVDIDPSTCNIDPGEIEAAVSRRTKVLLPVHLYGQPADMGRIMAIAHRHGLRVIESASQAHGASYLDRRVGTIGDLGCFSCQPDDNLGAYGEAGVIITNNIKLGERVRRFRDRGLRRTSGRFWPRPSGRLDPLQAAVLRVKLRHLEQWNELRRNVAASYRDMLQDTAVCLPHVDGSARPVYARFVIRTPYRSHLRESLASGGIDTGIHYPVPLHLQPAYRFLNYTVGDFPESERAAGEVLSLPIYPEMTREQVFQVAQAIEGAFATT